MFGWLFIGDVVTLHMVKVELPRLVHRLTHEVVIYICKADLSSTPSRRPQPPTSELWMPLPPPTSAVLPAP